MAVLLTGYLAAVVATKKEDHRPPMYPYDRSWCADNSALIDADIDAFALKYGVTRQDLSVMTPNQFVSHVSSEMDIGVNEFDYEFIFPNDSETMLFVLWNKDCDWEYFINHRP